MFAQSIFFFVSANCGKNPFIDPSSRTKQHKFKEQQKDKTYVTKVMVLHIAHYKQMI